MKQSDSIIPRKLDFEIGSDNFAWSDFLDFSLWHFAKELEHRVVAHDLFEKVSGSFWLRCWGMAFAPVFVIRTNGRLFALLRKRHHAGLTSWQKIKSHAVSLKLSARTWSRIILLKRPGYHPSSVAMPERVSAALQFNSSDERLISMPV